MDHRRPSQIDSEHQYRLHRGIAMLALEAKASGQELKDMGGRPLHYANHEARAFGFKELESRVKGRSTRAVIGTGAPRRTPWEWEKK